MFDATQNGFAYARKDPPHGSDNLKQRCLSSAVLWMLKRRANRPYLGPQRLPVAARAT